MCAYFSEKKAVEEKRLEEERKLAEIAAERAKIQGIIEESSCKFQNVCNVYIANKVFSSKCPRTDTSPRYD